MPILTLSTDIGQRDFIVGAIKGQFLQLMPSLNTVDISHYLLRTNFPLAAYICRNAIRYYPEGTYHLILVNVFESDFDHFLIASYLNQYIICPDNGLITMICGEKPSQIVKVPVSKNSDFLTITGDLAAAVLKLDEYKNIQSAGSPALEIVEKYPLRPTMGADRIEGQIIFIDQFENVIVNITREDFETHGKGRPFKIMVKRNDSIEKISSNYTGVAEHDKLAWFNYAGYLEIALRGGNMAGLFGLEGYSEHNKQSGSTAGNKWFYQTIRIFFE